MRGIPKLIRYVVIKSEMISVSARNSEFLSRFRDFANIVRRR